LTAPPYSLKTDCILSYPASVIQKLCEVTPVPERVQLTLSCEAIERTRRDSWAAGETEATSQAGAVEASAIDRAAIAGTRTGPGTGRSARKSASNAGRSARSTGRRGRSGGKSASKGKIPEAVETPEVGEITSAAEVPGSI
jgi:hypothetical protein